MQGEVRMACPNCSSGEIVLVPAMLVIGARFACPDCGSSVTLAPQSRETVRDGLDKLAEFTTGRKGGGGGWG